MKLTQLYGTLQDASGQPRSRRVTVQPQHPGVGPGGEAFTADPIEVRASTKSGRWSVSVAPSSIVGRYTVTIGRTRWYAWIPDGVDQIGFAQAFALALQMEGGQ